MRRLLNTLCIVGAMLVSSSGFAQEATTITNNSIIAARSCNSERQTYPKKKSCEPKKKACKPKPQCCPEPEPCCFFEQGLALDDDFTPPCDVNYGAAYNAPAEINVNSCMDVSIDASFIYWDYYQQGMDMGYINPVNSIVPTTQPPTPVATVGVPGEVIYQKTGYKPGFKVGIGWDTHFDNWAMNAEYTWFHHKQSTNVSVPFGDVGFTANSWWVDPGIAQPFFNLNNISSSWSMHMDLLDIVVGRPYYQGTHLTVSPTVGLRGLWIRQKVSIEAGGLALGATGRDITANTTSSSHNWSVGPKVGVGAQWLLWKGLRVDSVMGASLLYTRYTTLKHNMFATDFTRLATYTFSARNKNVDMVCPTFDLGLGLGYGMYAFRNKFYFDLSARYDFSQFWSQNVLRSFLDSLVGSGGAVGDLTMHGLTATLRCDF